MTLCHPTRRTSTSRFPAVEAPRGPASLSLETGFGGWNRPAETERRARSWLPAPSSGSTTRRGTGSSHAMVARTSSCTSAPSRATVTVRSKRSARRVRRDPGPQGRPGGERPRASERSGPSEPRSLHFRAVGFVPAARAFSHRHHSVFALGMQPFRRSRWYSLHVECRQGGGLAGRPSPGGQLRQSRCARQAHLDDNGDFGSMTSFAALGVDPRLVDALERAGITAPFAIQALTIPDAVAGRDVCGKAKTGSGKTLAFGLPLLRDRERGRSEPAGTGRARTDARARAASERGPRSLGEAVGCASSPSTAAPRWSVSGPCSQAVPTCSSPRRAA